MPINSSVMVSISTTTTTTMKKKIVIKVSVNCELCKKKVLKAITKLEGIDELLVEAEKGTVTVVGDVDPVKVAKRVRRTGRRAEIMNVGPPKPPEPNTPKPNNPQPNYQLPHACNDCQLVAVSFSPPDARFCVIL